MPAPAMHSVALKIYVHRQGVFLPRHTRWRSLLPPCINISILPALDRLQAVYLAKVLQKYVGLFAQGAQSKFAASLDATRLTDLAYLKEQLIAWGRPVNET